MTTIVQNPNDSSSAGWVALVIVLLGVIVLGALYYTSTFEGLVKEDNDVINIDLPEEVVPDTSDDTTDTETTGGTEATVQ